MTETDRCATAKNHGNRAEYCESADRYVLGRTDEGRCPFCGEDLTGARYEALQQRVSEAKEGNYDGE